MEAFRWKFPCLSAMIARYDKLVNGKEEVIDVSRFAVGMNGNELRDREFISAIREPGFSVEQGLDCYRIIGELAQRLGARGNPS